jgi:hypothetical protein
MQGQMERKPINEIDIPYTSLKITSVLVSDENELTKMPSHSCKNLTHLGSFQEFTYKDGKQMIFLESRRKRFPLMPKQIDLKRVFEHDQHNQHKFFEDEFNFADSCSFLVFWFQILEGPMNVCCRRSNSNRSGFGPSGYRLQKPPEQTLGSLRTE